MSVLSRIPVLGALLASRGGITEKAKNLQALAEKLLAESPPNKAAMELCLSEMTNHLIKIKLALAKYKKLTDALAAARKIGSVEQVSKLKAALEALDKKNGSYEILQQLHDEFVKKGNELDAKIKSI